MHSHSLPLATSEKIFFFFVFFEKKLTDFLIFLTPGVRGTTFALSYAYVDEHSSQGQYD